jgi:hypothetical protein
MPVFLVIFYNVGGLFVLFLIGVNCKTVVIATVGMTVLNT